MNVKISSSATGFAAVACLSAIVLGQGGENANSAVPLALNVTTTGTTVGFADDSDEVCPYSGSIAPDVYYSYVPAMSHSLTVELCDSGYDTKTYVYDSTLNVVEESVFGLPACNDDACSDAGGNVFRSLLNCVPLEAGLQYFIVVDGFGEEAGNYTITTRVSETFLGDPDACLPFQCVFDCYPDDQLEGEDCDDAFAEEDCYNGGCNCQGQDLTNPTAFIDIECNVAVCGTANQNGESRNTDWYRHTESGFGDTVFVWSVEAEFPAYIGRVDNQGINDCTGVTCCFEFTIGELACQPLETTSPALPDGVYWFFVAPTFAEVITCTSDSDGTPLDYRAGLQCEWVPPPPCWWDLSGNQEVDFQDLLSLLANWGPCGAGNCPWDFNGDDQVGFQDLLKLLANWGPCPG